MIHVTTASKTQNGWYWHILSWTWPLLIGLGFRALIAVLPGTMLVVPIGLMALLIVFSFWVMPQPLAISTKAPWVAFAISLVAFVLWPSYISIQIPGFPWISFTRMCLLVSLLIWLYCIFNSSEMRQNVGSAYHAGKPIFFFFLLYMAVLFVSLFMSREIGDSATKFILYQIYYSFVFFAVVSLVTNERRIAAIVIIIVATAGIEILIAGHEWSRQRVVLLDFLPPGFSADSEYLQRIVASKYRAGKYRAQGTFTVNLTYAEFLAISLPFAVYLAIEARKWLVRGLGIVVLAIIIPGIVIADSRSGLIGGAIGLLGSIALFAFRRWRTDKSSLFGPALAILFPLIAGGFVVAVMTSRTLSIMILGDGAQAASTAARGIQWDMGLPRIASSPLLGHGVGQAAGVLGFRSPSGVLTIDTWVLSSLLESGLLGFGAFCGMVFFSMGKGIWLYIDGRAPTSALGGAIAMALFAFAVIKTVLSQVDNHTIIFMLCALVATLSVIENRYRQR